MDKLRVKPAIEFILPEGFARQYFLTITVSRSVVIGVNSILCGGSYTKGRGGNVRTDLDWLDNRDRTTDDKSHAAGLVAGGAAAGGGVAAGVGGMGLVGGFGGVAIGAAPVVAAGAVVGAAAYGAKKAIEEGDGNALGAMAGGAAAVGGMGLAVGGGAIAIGMAPIAAAGAVIGLAGYGLNKLFGGNSEEKKPEIEGKDRYLLEGNSNDKTLEIEGKDSYPFM